MPTSKGGGARPFGGAGAQVELENARLKSRVGVLEEAATKTRAVMSEMTAELNQLRAGASLNASLKLGASASGGGEDAKPSEEVRALEAAGGLGPTARQALGYAQALELAEGRCGRAEFIAEVALRTRQFVRRQRTWFRRYPEIAWAPEDLVEEPAALLEWALATLERD